MTAEEPRESIGDGETRPLPHTTAPMAGEAADKLDAVGRSVVQRVARQTGRALATSFDADDITQEAWLTMLSTGNAALTGAHALEQLSEDELRRRLHQLASFEILTAARVHARLAREPEVQHEQILDALPAVGAPHPLARGEVRAEWRRILARLPREERWTVYLRYWFDVPFETIAVLLRRPSVHAVHCIHARAIQRLKKYCGPDAESGR